MIIIGFKGKNNTSQLIVSLFACDKFLLTNSFNGIEKDIKQIAINDEVIVMFGIDKNLINEIRIEPIAKINDNILKSSLDCIKINNYFLKNRINSIIAKIPTNYLCNYAYYKVLEKSQQAIFIHIPSIKNTNQALLINIKNLLSNLFN